MRVAVVGLGHLGTYHARIWAGLSDVELTAVVDIEPDRVEAVSGEFHVPGFSDWREIPAGVDAVSLAVPTALHGSLGVEILNSGRHLLVEKPIARTVGEAEALIAAAQGNGKTLMVGHTERFNPAVVAMMELISQPRFIEAQRMASFAPRCLDVDVILDLMIHDLDLALLLAGPEVKEVRAIGVSAFTDRIDIANARIEFDSGCVANLTASRVSREAVRKLRIFQANRYLSLDYSSRTLLSCRIESSEKEFPSLVVEPVAVSAGDPLKRQLQSFASSVHRNIPPACSGEEAKRALQLAHQVLARM